MFNKAEIEKYFSAEKQQALIFLVIGLVAIVLAVVFFFAMKSSFFKGAAIPVLVIGILLATVGFVTHKKSDADRVRNVYAYDLNPEDLKQKELPRMQKVMKTFSIAIITELILIAVGAGLFLYFSKIKPNDFWRGFGLLLAIVALAALIMDKIAESRSKKYKQQLELFVSKN